MIYSKSIQFSLFVILVVGVCPLAISGHDWQQHVDYVMDIDFNHETHQFSGAQILTYTNHSPDTLNEVYYHLYFNAFQPNSMMDVRSRTIADPDMRIGARISNLSADEMGWHKVRELTMDGNPVSFTVEGTILIGTLTRPILPGQTVRLEMEFDSQVPIQIRRSGRDNEEGVDYSMAQWYPKLCAYDEDGWHPDPYIAREFYGDFGKFDVTIHIAPEFEVAATGAPAEVQGDVIDDPGYSGARPWEPVKQPPQVDPGKKTWRFVAENVHDFVWAADPDYKHIRRITSSGLELHFYFIETPDNERAWRQAQPIIEFVFDRISRRLGPYPYERFTIIQGGDGGMEYPMATLITGNRSLHSLVGVIVHEALHSWFHGVLGNNESLYSWMDEGFVTFSEGVIMRDVAEEGLIPGLVPEAHLLESDYQRYLQFAALGNEEPMTTHADHYSTNTAYYVNAYSKGGVFLYQLQYIVGEEQFWKGMQRYYKEWMFKHPGPLDFIRTMEKTSGMILDWYYEYWILSTKVVDYQIKAVEALDVGSTRLLISRNGGMPMPVDLVVTLRDGKTIGYYIPLVLMRGEKRPDFPADEWYILDDWPWTHPVYAMRLPFGKDQILSIEIDPSGRLADVAPDDNVFPNANLE